MKLGRRTRKTENIRVISFGLLSFLLLGPSAFAFPPHRNTNPICIQLLDSADSGLRSLDSIPPRELTQYVSQKMRTVPEFEFIRSQAEALGIRVWLFGGTASGFLHYAKWDLGRVKGLLNLQADRFDYDFTNIFRSTQDLDIVVDAEPAVASRFREILADQYPHFLGSKTKWEVRTLRHRIGKVGEPGFKEALLDDADFHLQNTDSNSVGMVELTRHPSEPIVRDLRMWDQARSTFLEDALKGRISFYRNPRHFETSRAKAGENPEILSVIRLLVKAFQYELGFSATDLKKMKSIIRDFRPEEVTNVAARRRIEDTAKKLILHAVNIEYAMNQLEALGLRQKLIAMGDRSSIGDAAWWLNREPLRSKPVGEGSGRTAQELGITVVAHETSDFLAHESITRAHSGEPNILQSRKGFAGEKAEYGDGTYTQIGREGAAGSGMTVRFEVDPRARESTDFDVHGSYVLFHNKKALRVIQEPLNLSFNDLEAMLSDGRSSIDRSDLARLEKLKRKMNVAYVKSEIEKRLRQDPSFGGRLRVRDLLRGMDQLRLLSKPVVDESLYSLYRGFTGEEIRSSIQQGDAVTREEIARIFLSRADTADRKGLIRFFIDHGNTSSIRDLIRYVFSQPNAREMEDLVQLLINRDDAEILAELARMAFSQPHAEKWKNSLQLLAQRAYAKIQADWRPAETLVRDVFGKPHAIGMISFVESFLNATSRSYHVHESMMISIAKHILSKPHAKDMTRLFDYLILSGSPAAAAALAEHVFSKPHAKGMKDRLRWVIQRTAGRYEDMVTLEKLIEHALTQPHYLEDSPEMIDILRLMISKGDSQIRNYILVYILSLPPWNHPRHADLVRLTLER